jgi:hypothetical protein
MRYIIILLTAVYFYSCSNIVTEPDPGTLLDTDLTTADINTPDSLKYIYQEWQNWYEQEVDSVKIFISTAGGILPVSRYRETIEFFRGGTFHFLYLAPNDGHYLKTGRWMFSSRDRNIIRLEYSEERIRFIKIVELKRNIFKFYILY